MATNYSAQMNKLRNSTPKQVPLVADFGAPSRHQIADITLATQASGDTIEIALLPIGARVISFSLLTDTSLGSSTVAIGIAGSTAKYKAAAVFTATDTPTSYMKTAAGVAPLTVQEVVIVTIAAANFPASGNLRIVTTYTDK